jgi:hypothetical protein
VSPKASGSVPEIVQLPAGRVPLVLIAPEPETRTPQGSEVATKLTAPFWPVVVS